MSNEQNTFSESDYVVITSPGNTYDGVMGRIAEVHVVGDGYGYIVHLAANPALALGAYRADQLRKIDGRWAVPTQADFDAMYRAEMAQQYARTSVERAQAVADGKRFLKVGDAYLAIDQILSVRAGRDGDAQIRLKGEFMFNVREEDTARRLIAWAERHAYDLRDEIS